MMKPLNLRLEERAKPRGRLLPVQTSSASPSADPQSGVTTGSGGTGGVETLDADSIKAVKGGS